MKKKNKEQEELYMVQDDRNHPDAGRTAEEIRRGMEEAEKRLANGRRERLLEECRIK